MTSSALRTLCYDWAKTFSLHPRPGRQRPCLTAEPVVIDYETFCKTHDCHAGQGLTIAQTARALGLDPRTVATWVARSRFEPRRSRPRGSVLDPFKSRITRLLDTHPYSAQQIFQRLREEGYRGGVTILRDYVRRIRPTKRPVYLKLHFAPGECAQVDWGAYGTVAVVIPVAGFRSSSWCWRSAAKCLWSSPSPRPWSISSPATNTASPPWVCRPKSWSTISNPRFCSAWPAPHRCSIRAISTLPATTALRSRPAMSPAPTKRRGLHTTPHSSG